MYVAIAFRADRSMYHALGYGTFMYLQAIMTFDPRDIEAASEVLKQSVEVCNKQRRKNTIGESLGKMVKKVDYNSYSEDEIHAELCYAECLLLRAVLSFIEDETLISFIKGSIKIRACYQSYKECWHILEGRDFSKDKFKIHFESGVRMGVGTFNLMISQLPARVLKLLEFVGFTTSRHYGLKELEKGFALEGSLRQFLCALVLLGYHSFATYAFGTNDGDLATAQRILDDQLKHYPNGALFLFFQARLHFIRGGFTDAALVYERSRLSQMEWRQFHHICYWELYWTKTLKGLYSEAQEHANTLLSESKWSKATYAYQKACALCMRQEFLSEQEKEELRTTMRSIPDLKQRIAGKSLPVEKFAIKKSRRFFAQGERLTLAAMELFYVWNFARILAKSSEDIERVYTTVERELKQMEKIKPEDRSEYYWDNLLLVRLLRGSCLAQMKSPLQAAEEFKFIISNEKKIKEDTYLVPFSLLEVALLHLNAGDLEQAKIILEHTKSSYKGFSLESRLHFRIHSTLNRIKAVQRGNSSVTPFIPQGGLPRTVVTDFSSIKIPLNTNDSLIENSSPIKRANPCTQQLGYRV
ncbi:Tetratricopeptide repeat protein 39B [Armadillidium nasatum]|uniref:Tetratricopeptide repeat protein 39B n=1 Tax=Armadillidium nasatum TaxID=96803 RepID=A0A5N5SV23_9CRUS|nr:Tetratricopeptide repeat protein 39B [Armadillidium nasatum]